MKDEWRVQTRNFREDSNPIYSSHDSESSAIKEFMRIISSKGSPFDFERYTLKIFKNGEDITNDLICKGLRKIC